VSRCSKRKFDNIKYSFNPDCDNQINIISLNTNGISSNTKFLNKVALKYDVIVLQETMSLNTKKIKDIFKNNGSLSFYNKKATRTHKNGRGSGGLSFITRKSFKSNAYFPSDRIGVLTIENLAIISVYLPYYKPNDPIQFELYRNEISKLNKCTSDLNKNGYKIIITGDFNVDNYNEANANEYINMFNNFVTTNKLNNVDTEMAQSINYTFKTHKTWLDHVLIFDNLLDNINVVISEDYTSRSDHFPTIIQTSFEKRHIAIGKKDKMFENMKQTVVESSVFKLRFQTALTENITKLENMISSLNHKDDHQSNIDMLFSSYYSCINDSITTANGARESDEKFKYVRNNSWWSDETELLFEEKESLKLKLIRSKTDEQRIKVIKRQLEAIKKKWERHGLRGNLTKIKQNFYHERTNFWKNLRKNLSVTNEVDLTTNEIKDQFEVLFNNKLLTYHDDKILKLEIDEHLKNNNTLEKLVVNEEALIKIINNLHNNKANGRTGLNNSILKLSIKNYDQATKIFKTNHRMLNIIKTMFQYIFDHKIFPSDFNTSEMYALVKDNNKSSSDPGNIRPISVSDTLTNIFEKLVLELINLRCPNIRKQFGFSKNASCSHAVMVLKETMNFCKLKRKKLFITAIDASKAFDKVNRSLLWLILFKKIGTSLTVLLMNYYNASKAYVINKNEQSGTFKTTIGVKQGGPLSPRLFSIYIEDIEKLIDDTGIGIKIHEIVINILLYADDIVLISETKRDMQRLIDITENFGKIREIKFNPDKTNFLSVNGHCKIKNKKYENDLALLKMDNNIIDEVVELKYLGSYINNKLMNKTHLDDRFKMAACSVNTLANNIGFNSKILTPKIKVQLYKTYIRPVLTYGLENLIMNNSQLDKMHTMECNIIKCALNLSTRLESTDLMTSLGIERINDKIDTMIPSFFARLLDNVYTKSYIINLIKACPKRMHPKSIINFICHKFKSQNIEQLKVKCNHHKLIMAKNFEYEKNEIKANSELPELLENFNNNIREIIHYLRVF
jgi:hypothetical protein